jgi:hypothetical protein
MNTTTKLLVAGLAGTGLLLSACEIPGSGPPLDIPTIVTPNAEGRTPFSGFPAVFKGTLVGQEDHVPSSQNLISWYDAFTTTVTEELTLTISCSVYNSETVVYIDGTTGTDGDDYLYCSDGPQQVTTVSGGEVYIEVGTEDTDGYVHAYVVHADVVNNI